MPRLVLIEVGVRPQTREDDILDSVDVDVAQVVVDLRPGSVEARAAGSAIISIPSTQLQHVQ